MADLFDILGNFEISLVVFIPNAPGNHAISYTDKQTTSKHIFYSQIERTEGNNFPSFCHRHLLMPKTAFSDMLLFLDITLGFLKTQVSVSCAQRNVQNSTNTRNL